MLIVATVPSAGAAGLDSEILLYPSATALDVGSDMEVRVVVTVLHGYCPITLDDTIPQISPNASIVGKTQWASLGASRYEQVITIRGVSPGVGTLRVYRQCPKFGLLQKEVQFTVTAPALPSVEPLILTAPDTLSLGVGDMVEWNVTVQSVQHPDESGVHIVMPEHLAIVSEAAWVQRSASRYQKMFVLSGTSAGTGTIDITLPDTRGDVRQTVHANVTPVTQPDAGEALSILPASLEVGLGETAFVTIVLSNSGIACTDGEAQVDIAVPSVLEIEDEGPWVYDDASQTRSKQITVSGSMGGSAELSVMHACEGVFLSSLAPVTVVPYALNPLTDQEIFVDIPSIDIELGDTLSFTVAIKVIHSNCPLTIDDTQIVLPAFLSLFSQTPWEQVESNLYEKTVTVRADSDGSGYVSIIRDCPRYGLLEKQIPAAAGTGELPSGGLPPSDMPIFDWAAMKNLSLAEVAALYGVDASALAATIGSGVSESMTLHDIKNAVGITKYELQGILEDAYSEDHGIVYDLPEPERISGSLLFRDYLYIFLVLAGSVLFARKKYKLRLAMLGVSLLYFGFYLRGCMCQLGVFANFFIFDTIELHWIVLLLVPVASTLAAGRSFCGWVCFFGTIQEYLYEARKRVLPIRTRRKLPAWLSYSKFVVLGLILYYAIVSSRVVFCDYDPFFYIIYRMFSLDTLGVLTVLLVVGSLFIERPFCRYACPMGAVLMAADTLAVNRVRVDGAACNTCGLCNRVCPMNRDLVSGHGECINCGKCLEACRKGALYYGKKKRA